MAKVKNRNIFLFIILNTITLGIYGIVAICIMSNEINETCKGDGKKTMFYLWAFLLGIVTLGIVPLVWFYKAMERLKDNGYRYGVNVKHSGAEFILWMLLGSLIAVGPIVALCYFVSDVNQFSDYVGIVPAKRYSDNPLERLQIEKEPFYVYDENGNIVNPENGQVVDAFGNVITPESDLGSEPGSEPTMYAKNAGNISWISGDYSGYSFPVNPGEEVIVGRDPSIANIIIDQRFTTVSKRHCGIRFDQNTQLYTVTDYSSNGTFINGGIKLESNKPLQLASDTVVSIGNGENSFRLD